MGIAAFLVFSSGVIADDLPDIYINDSSADTLSGFVLNSGTVYVSPDKLAEIFNLVLSIDSDNIVYNYANKTRKITYDSASGSVIISDLNSFRYDVLDSEYPSFLYENVTYIPLRMICYALNLNISYDTDAHAVKISSFGGSVGLYNSAQVAVAYRNGKYGLVNSDGEVVLKFSYDAISNYDNENLFKITYNHRCGLANSDGEIICDVIYNEIRYETEGEIYLSTDDKVGLCDVYGNIIIPAEYDDITYCGNLVAMVKTNKKWRVLDCKTGHLSYEYYDEVYEITTGIQSDNDMIKGYYVNRNSKWGCVDSFGNIVIDLKYDALDKFDLKGRARIIYDNKFGIIDCGGRMIIPPAYDYIYPFGTLDVTVAQMGNKYGVLSSDFEVVVPFDYEYIYPYNDNPATVVYKDGLFGVISSDGVPLAEPYYTYLEEFKNGLALAYDEGYGYIDFTGNEVIECVHSDVKQGTALSVFLKKDNLWALYSPLGHKLTDYIYNSAGEFCNGLSAVSVMENNTEKFGYVNDSGDVIIPFIYTSAQNFKYGKAIVSSGRYSGIIDVEGHTIIPFVYTGFNPSYDYNVIAAANEFSKWGLISLDNRKLSDFIYDYIFEFENGIAPVVQNGSYGVINSNGILIVDIEYDSKEAALGAASFYK